MRTELFKISLKIKCEIPTQTKFILDLRQMSKISRRPPLSQCARRVLRTIFFIWFQPIFSLNSLKFALIFDTPLKISENLENSFLLFFMHFGHILKICLGLISSKWLEIKKIESFYIVLNWGLSFSRFSWNFNEKFGPKQNLDQICVKCQKSAEGHP